MVNSADIKEETANVEYEPESSPVAKPTFRQKVVAHFKRFWWAHLIFNIVALLVIVLLV